MCLVVAEKLHRFAFACTGSSGSSSSSQETNAYAQGTTVYRQQQQQQPAQLLDTNNSASNSICDFEEDGLQLGATMSSSGRVDAAGSRNCMMPPPQRMNGRCVSSSSSVDKGPSRGGFNNNQIMENVHAQRQQALPSSAASVKVALPQPSSSMSFIHSEREDFEEASASSASSSSLSVGDNNEDDMLALFRRAQQQQQQQQQHTVGLHESVGLSSHAMNVINMSGAGITSLSPGAGTTSHGQLNQQHHMHVLHQMHADASAASNANSTTQLRQTMSHHYHAGSKERLGEMI
jgi:hypothetical protein